MNRDEMLKLLRESIDLENRADLAAVSYKLREANYLMQEANRLRRKVFAEVDPNELRERTHEALRARSSQ